MPEQGSTSNAPAAGASQPGAAQKPVVTEGWKCRSPMCKDKPLNDYQWGSCRSCGIRASHTWVNIDYTPPEEEEKK